jgi:hypothetical protein
MGIRIPPDDYDHTEAGRGMTRTGDKTPGAGILIQDLFPPMIHFGC